MTFVLKALFTRIFRNICILREHKFTKLWPTNKFELKTKTNISYTLDNPTVFSENIIDRPNVFVCRNKSTKSLVVHVDSCSFHSRRRLLENFDFCLGRRVLNVSVPNVLSVQQPRARLACPTMPQWYRNAITYTAYGPHPRRQQYRTTRPSSRNDNLNRHYISLTVIYRRRRRRRFYFLFFNRFVIGFFIRKG